MRRGFSLVEILIAVAVLGVLAGLAGAALHGAQVTAKEREISSNVDGLAALQWDMLASYDGFVEAAVAPRGTADLDKQAVPWVTNSGFQALGWAPDGPPRAQIP